MLVNSIEMLQKAKKEKYAIPQFNINNLEWTKYILEECQANNVPVILGVSEGADIMFEKAMKSGDDRAALCLGNLYEKGKGVEKNCRKAVELYKKASNSNIKSVADDALECLKKFIENNK